MKHAPLILGTILAFIPLAESHAAVISWLSPTDGGDWDTPTAWEGNVLPDDVALLGDVISGTRTITVTSPASLSVLSMNQTTVGATNRLEVGSSLTLSGNVNPFQLTRGAAGANLEIAVQSDGLLRAERNNSIVSTLNATVQVATSGTLEAVATSGSAAITFSGPTSLTGGILSSSAASSTGKITLSGTFTADLAGKVEARGGNSVLETTGNAHLQGGSDLILLYTGASGTAQFTNTGTLLMEGATLTFDWAAATDGSGARAYSNEGTWRLTQNSSVRLISSTGRQTTGGFTNLSANGNSGTLKVESGSTLLFRGLYNTGLLEAGSASGNVSDATVLLGGNQITGGITFTNGLTPSSTVKSGTLLVKGNAVLGHNTEVTNAGAINVNNGSAASTGSLIQVGDGVTPLTFTIGAYTSTTLTNFSGNRVEILDKATLDLRVFVSTNTNASSTLSNAGMLLHSGTLKLQSNQSGGSKTIANSGTYQIGGVSASIVNSPNSNGSNTASAIIFNNTGTLSGITTADKLTYSNLSGNAARNILTIATQNGTLAPGNGTGDEDRVGSLTLENVSLTFSGNSKISLDIAGSAASGLFDSLTLTGEGGALQLGTETTLDIHLAESALFEGTYRLIKAVSIDGSFAHLLFNGASAEGHYTLNIGSTYIDLVAVPEPSLLLPIAGGAVILSLARRQRKRF